MELDDLISEYISRIDTQRLAEDFTNGLDIWCGDFPTLKAAVLMLDRAGVHPMPWSDAEYIVADALHSSHYAGVTSANREARDGTIIPGQQLYGNAEKEPRRKRPCAPHERCLTLDEVLVEYAQPGEDQIEISGNTVEFI